MLQEIEQKRYEMIVTAKMYGLRSIEVIKLSQELDVLLNKYYKSLKRISGFTHIQKNAM
jgi:hypothetical protein